jgi:hypothetical protein
MVSSHLNELGVSLESQLTLVYQAPSNHLVAMRNGFGSEPNVTMKIGRLRAAKSTERSFGVRSAL